MGTFGKHANHQQQRPVSLHLSNETTVTASTTYTDNSISNLYVNEETSINQILAYVGVYDPDSGENGTIRSIDLSLVNVKKPTLRCLKQRQTKLDRLKTTTSAATSVSQAFIREQEAELDMLMSVQTQEKQMPVRLTKIGEKLFTLQLTNKLNFNWLESYSIEMRIRDNGTRPQLESKTRINLNVIGNNKYAPVFLGKQNVEIEVEDNLLGNETTLFR